MKCSICNKPIILSPSAEERAKKAGGNPSDYTKLFTTHADCAIAKRNQYTSDLIKRINDGKTTIVNSAICQTVSVGRFV